MDEGIELRDIPGYERLYAASRCGKVWSHTNSIWRKQTLGARGYFCLMLSKGGKVKCCYVHRLVAKAWLGNSPLSVNHKNGVKVDNHLDNLEYCTHKENMNHAWRTGLVKCRGEDHPASKLTERDVVAILKDKEKTLAELAGIYGVNPQAIHKVKQRKRWAHVKI